MTDAELERIIKRADEGGFRRMQYHVMAEGAEATEPLAEGLSASTDPRAIGNFIVHAYDDITALVQEVVRLKTELAERS